MNLERSLEMARQLRDELAAEVERARAERQLIRTLDAAALFTRASERGAFVAEVARLERELSLALGRAAGTAGLVAGTLERLEALAPEATQVLKGVLSEVRSLASALQEIDRLNLKLADRALACVRGYVEALRPSVRAYDRRGLRGTSAPALAMVSSKG
ncbi:MAG TPA: flagellar export chaperone FlgN [Anaeromyxobacteraceae bacterium]|nr:flagellar export chaperone FlgN [Anaeromyxobacteraceae bacterium]